MTSSQRARVVRTHLRNRFGTKGVSVKMGTGTARHWLYIGRNIEGFPLYEGDKSRDRELVEILAKEAVEMHGDKVPTFDSDDGFGSSLPCLSVNYQYSL